MAEETTPKRRSRGHSTSASVGEGLGIHIGPWERSLRAANRSARTVQIYLESARQPERFLEASSLPADPAALRQEHIEAWIEADGSHQARASAIASPKTTREARHRC